jgi:phage terminase small subunit
MKQYVEWRMQKKKKRNRVSDFGHLKPLLPDYLGRVRKNIWKKNWEKYLSVFGVDSISPNFIWNTDTALQVWSNM